VDHWFGNSPSISTLSSGLRYIVQPLLRVSSVVPYVGAFANHSFVSDNFDDIDTVGARVGLEYMNGHTVLGIGVGFQHVITTCFQDCDQFYPELSFGYAF